MEKDTGFADTRAYEWLEAYAAEYGFILRWPQERQAATGMVFEPWHWRYVAGTTPSPSAPPASRWKSIWRWNKRNNTKGR